LKKGKIIIEGFDSRILKNNPLKDPSFRSFPVYLPPSYDSPGKKFPVVYLLMGFTGEGKMSLNLSFLNENIEQRLNRLMRSGKIKEMIVVLPDCITKYGGSQFINSTATGRYEDYIVKEIVPFIDKKYRTIPSSNSRAVMGKSSGGYGAVMLSMRNPNVFGLMCSTAGDMYFEYCYFSDLKFIRDLKKYGKGDKAIANFIKKELNYKHPKPKSFHSILNTIGMASCYSPNPNGFKTKGYNFDMPLDIETGEMNIDVMKRWHRHDPARLVGKYKKNLKKLKLIFIDAGTRDEFYLDIGARIFCDKLKKNGINFIHEEFNDGHFNLQYRYDRVLEVISDKIGMK
jgi:S-formylglutathione hydrolase FrmB